MKLMARTAHLHGGRLAGCRHRRQVRIDVILPQAYPREDVRWHMQRMRCPGSNLRITSRRRKSQLRKLRFIVGMNQIVRDARMVRLGREKFFKHGGRFLAVDEGLSLIHISEPTRLLSISYAV